MPSLRAKEIRQEWTDSCRRPEDILGAPLSVPNGYSSRGWRTQPWRPDTGWYSLRSQCKGRSDGGDGRILGRYSMQQGVSAETAVKLALGDWTACGRGVLRRRN
jgi:hypothetical protein